MSTVSRTGSVMSLSGSRGSLVKANVFADAIKGTDPPIAAAVASCGPRTGCSEKAASGLNTGPRLVAGFDFTPRLENNLATSLAAAAQGNAHNLTRRYETA